MTTEDRANDGNVRVDTFKIVCDVFPRNDETTNVEKGDENELTTAERVTE